MRKCMVFGGDMTAGMTDEDGFYCHAECFDQACAETFGCELEPVDDDGCGGYYLWYDAREGEWCGTGIYYTEWEE